MSTTVKNSKMARRYGEDFKRQAVELILHSGKTQRQVARELDVSEYSLNLWRKAYLGQMKPAQIEGEMKSPEEMAKIIREQHKELAPPDRIRLVECRMNQSFRRIRNLDQ